MNLLIWLIVGSALGAIIGTVFVMAKRTAQRNELLLNIVAGAIGALLGGSLLAPIFGTGSIDPHHYSNAKLVVAIISALSLLLVVNVFASFNKR